MEEKILLFINHLRKGGVKVSLVETLDCFEALTLVDWDKETFYNTLLSTIVKDYENYPLFNKLFHYHFSKAMLIEEESKKASIDIACDSGDGDAHSVGGAGQGRSSFPVENFVQTIRLGDEKDFAKLIEEGIGALGELQEKDIYERDEIIRKIKVKLQWKMGEYELEKIYKDIREKEKIQIEEKLKDMEILLQDKLDEALLKKFKTRALDEILNRANLRELDFYALSHNQIQEVRRKVMQLAHKLATRNSKREKPAKRGRINLQGTIRKAMNTGGVPLYLAYKDRKPSRPEFFVLCDLSGSVKIFSEFMLQLVYSIQTRFIHVRSFAFVDTIHEITGYFKSSGINEGIKNIYYHGKFSKTGFSHYGESFEAFNSSYLTSVTRKTTILILGDARNNYRQPYSSELKKIKDQAYRVIWLNPAPLETWDKDDSIIGTYEPYCHQVQECRNLKQLEKVVLNIF